MTLIVPNAQEATLLSAWIAQHANWTLKLYGNNVTPAVGDVAGTYTEIAGGGYASIALASGSWVITQGVPTKATYAVQLFTFTGTLNAPGTIYGYYIVDSSGALVCAERLAAPPFSPAVNGDAVAVTPQVAVKQI